LEELQHIGKTESVLKTLKTLFDIADGNATRLCAPKFVT